MTAPKSTYAQVAVTYPRDGVLGTIYEDSMAFPGALCIYDPGFSVAARSCFGSLTGVPASGSALVNLADKQLAAAGIAALQL